MKKLTSKKQLILYGCSGLGVNMMNIIMGSYLCSALLKGGFVEHVENWTYLNRDLVIAGVWMVFAFLAKALDGIIDLPFAALADNLKSRFGRRKTAILIGFVPMVIAYLLFLVPLNEEATLLNTVWFGLLLCAFYTFYTLTMLTYYATFYEVTENERDTVFLSNTKSICDVVYFSLSFALIPVFISLGVNIRIVALIFLPLALSMMIPMFLLKENDSAESTERPKPLTLGRALSVSFKNKAFMFWMCVYFVMTIGMQLFLGGINELFSSTGLNMTFVMASSFAPVPLTLMLYNRIVKRRGLAVAFRVTLAIYSVGMLVMYLCSIFSTSLTELQLTLIAIFGGILVSFSLGSFFSVPYTVPSHLAQVEFNRSGNGVASMYFAVDGLFGGVASGIATGVILVALKSINNISLLPIIVIICMMTAFCLTFFLPNTIKNIGKGEK